MSNYQVSKGQPKRRAGFESSGPHEEGFFDILKSAVKIGAPILGGALKTGLPFLGPVGMPIGAIAGLALNAASKLAESTDTEAGGIEDEHVNEGTM
jgi:hypothetical protein